MCKLVFLSPCSALTNRNSFLVPCMCGVHTYALQAKEKVHAKGWTNVHVTEADACDFKVPEGEARLVTFSYSLPMIPPFHEAIDNAVLQLAPDGFLGAADFFVSGKYDTPMRQTHWGRRFSWR